jgi:hypothetical protein
MFAKAVDPDGAFGPITTKFGLPSVGCPIKPVLRVTSKLDGTGPIDPARPPPSTNPGEV